MNFKKVISWAMVASVFMDDFIILRYVLPFDFYWYYITYAISIIYYIRTSHSISFLPKWFTISVGALVLTTLSITFIENTFGLSVVKQLIGVVFSSIAYYTFLKYNDFEVKRIFRMYVFLAFFVALEGLIEEILNLNGIHINQKFRLTASGYYRIFGIMGEPYFMAVAMIPAMYFTFYKTITFEKIISKFNNFILFSTITVCFIFTFSSAGILGLGGVFYFWLYNKKYLSLTSWKIILLPIFLVVFVILFNNLQSQWKEFSIKFNQTLSIFNSNTNNKEEINDLNTSSFALYSNFVIAKASFSEKPLTGTGLGTHESNYKKHFSKYFDKDFVIRYGVFNTADANSLFIRLMSETGLMGLGLFFLFMFKNFIRKIGFNDPLLRDYILINQGIFIWFVVRLVRTGNYFGNGFFLFFFMYYICNKIVKEKTKQVKTSNEASQSYIS